MSTIVNYNKVMSGGVISDNDKSNQYLLHKNTNTKSTVVYYCDI